MRSPASRRPLTWPTSGPRPRPTPTARPRWRSSSTRPGRSNRSWVSSGNTPGLWAVRGQERFVRAPPLQFLSSPSSAWGRTSAKLRFALVWRRGPPVSLGKRSFPTCVPRQSLGTRATSPLPTLRFCPVANPLLPLAPSSPLRLSPGCWPDPLLMRRYRTEIVVCLALTALALGALGHVCWNGFVNYDDGDYVVRNARVRAGLSRVGLAWAFTATHA